jgi:hypothetical protein
MKLKEGIFTGIFLITSLVGTTAGIEDSQLLGPGKKLGDERSAYNLLVNDGGPKMVFTFMVNHRKIEYYTIYQDQPAPSFRSISRIVGSERYDDGFVLAFNELGGGELMDRAMVIYMQHNPTGSKLEAEWIRLSENIEILKQILSDKLNYGELILMRRMQGSPKVGK